MGIRRGVKCSRLLLLVMLLAFMGFGCTASKYWLQNRWSDFRDIGTLSVGVTSDNKYTGFLPSALGLYGEAGPLHIGLIGFGGMVAESEMRGAGIYAEKRIRFGTIWGEFSEINQSVGTIITTNYYKDSVDSAAWIDRMSTDLEWWNMPAKDLVHDDTEITYKVLPRGWQSFEYVGVEAAICDPFLTHLGIALRPGIDISEAMDFLLGWFWIDFRQDDRQNDE